MGAKIRDRKMSEESKYTFDFTDDEISSLSAAETKQWTSRIMMRFWKLFQGDPTKYDPWAKKLIADGNTISGWKTFLKEAVHKLRELLKPKLAAV